MSGSTRRAPCVTAPCSSLHCLSHADRCMRSSMHRHVLIVLIDACTDCMYGDPRRDGLRRGRGPPARAIYSTDSTPAAAAAAAAAAAGGRGTPIRTRRRSPKSPPPGPTNSAEEAGNRRLAPADGGRLARYAPARQNASEIAGRADGSWPGRSPPWPLCATAAELPAAAAMQLSRLCRARSGGGIGL
jgi:hypothetical protein